MTTTQLHPNATEPVLAEPAPARPVLAHPVPAEPAAEPAVAEPDGRHDEYAHLQPLLREYAGTPADDPHRTELRDRLVAGYLPVARHIARRYAQRGEPLDDLVQVASLGLINAIDRYEPERGHVFLAFAVPTITGEVRRHFRDKTWAMRVPRRLKELHASVSGAVLDLSHRLNRAPRPSEVAAELQLPVEEVLEALQASQSYRADSLDEMLTAAPDAATFGDLIGESDGGFDRFTDSHSLAPHLAALPERERRIVIMRFFDDMTQTQIAEKVGISQMHVSRLLAQTLTQLREATLAELPG